jgi:hypothetical protein
MSGATRDRSEGAHVKSAVPPGTTFDDYLEQTRNEPVYVILGVQGSGTNLLGRLLVRIFNFSLMRDRSLVFNAAARLGASPDRRDVERELVRLKRYLFPSAFVRKTNKYAIRDNEPFAGLERYLDPERIRSGADLANLVYAYRAYSLGTRLKAIKSDDLWETIPAIDRVLPNRRIVLITRDFRDNLVSIGGKTFGPIEPLRAAHYVKERLVPYAAEFRKAGPDALHVKFTTLVNAPRQFVDDFARHFQIAPATDPDAVIAAFPFRQGKIGKWKSLPPEQLAWVEGILYDELVEFGYPPESSQPSLPDRATILAATARDTVKRVPQKIRKVVDRLKS